MKVVWYLELSWNTRKLDFEKVSFTDAAGSMDWEYRRIEAKK